MRSLLPLTNAPGLAAYPADIRRLLVHRAFDKLHSHSRLATWLGILLPLGCGIVGVFVALWIKGYYSSSLPKPQTIAMEIDANFYGGPIGCAVGGLAWLLIRACLVRPYLHKAIAEHQQPVQPISKAGGADLRGSFSKLPAARVRGEN